LSAALDRLKPGPGEAVIDGHRLELFWIAPAQADRPAIVMLHEGLGSIVLWKDFPRALADATGCGVLVYSRYGYGASDRLTEKRAPDYMHHEGKIVLPALLAHLGIARPILFGHSDGASIALIYAGSFPDGPLGLVLEAPHVFVEDISIASIAAAKTAYETTDLGARLKPYHADPDRTFWGWNDIWLDPRFRDWNIEDHLAAIRCPMLLIQGEDDEYGTRAQLDAIAARSDRAEILLLPRCRHSPHRDQRQATLARVRDWVAVLSAAS
jgi:pimeloyl-ACP methyl ester carboxylesterase